MSLARLRPGDIGFGPIRGSVGFGIGAAQLTLAAAEPGLIWRQGWREWWGVRHVIVITEAAHPDYSLSPIRGTGPKAVQAMPRGAEEITLGVGHGTAGWTYVRPAYKTDISFGRYQSERVAAVARGYINTPYNFATYAAIPAHRAHIPVPHLDRYISSRRHMMCSQLADQCLSDAGWHVFDDGRLPQDVTPSELFRAMLMQPTAMIWRPGGDDDDEA